MISVASRVSSFRRKLCTRTEKRAVKPLLSASMEVRDHVPQLKEGFQLLFDFSKHVVLRRGKAENLVETLQGR